MLRGIAEKLTKWSVAVLTCSLLADTGDNMKAVQSMENSSKLQYCQLSMVRIQNCISIV